MALTVFITVKAFYQVVLNFLLVIKGNAVIKRANSDQKTLTPFNLHHNQLFHAFAIPSYNEDLSILAETLQVLAEHSRATSSYLIFLAME
jgi:hypothetical protein